MRNRVPPARLFVAGVAALVVACGRTEPRATVNRAPAASPVVSDTAWASPSSTGVQASWLVAVDSALDAALARDLFTGAGGIAPGFRACDDDAAAPAASPALAAGRVRLLRDLVPLPSVASPRLASRSAAVFRIEVTSAARFDPVGADVDRRYVARVGPRVDTLAVRVEDVHGMDARWAICLPARMQDDSLPRVRWDFAHAGNPGLLITTWEPATASWAEITRVADSIAGRP